METDDISKNETPQTDEKIIKGEANIATSDMSTPFVSCGELKVEIKVECEDVYSDELQSSTGEFHSDENSHTLELELKTESSTVSDQVFQSLPLEVQITEGSAIKAGDDDLKEEVFPSTNSTSPVLNPTNTDHEPCEENSSMQCQQCGKPCSSGDGVKGGSGFHSKNNQHVCQDCTMKKKSLRKSRTDGGSVPFQCHQCGKLYKRKDFLDTHLRTHEEVRPFTCTHCDKSFCRKSYLNCHLRIHDGITPFMCQYCSKSFTEKNNLKAHLRIHEGVRPFTCPHCAKSFTQKGSLTSHIRIHEGVRPFKCQHCDRAFTEKGSLNVHLRIHQGIRPFTCKHCDMAFTQKGSLNKHLRIHEGIRPYKCHYCSKSFRQKGYFTIHIRFHEGIRPYKCQYCPKAFSENGSLRTHLKIHERANKVSCEQTK